MIEAPWRAGSASAVPVPSSPSSQGEPTAGAGYLPRPPGLPRPGKGQPADGKEVDTELRRRMWLIACCLALAALTFVDRPGNIVADTKLDLAVNPLGFLERALHLWDPSQFGQLQNQASGYLFPMGPFFAVGKLIALPAWVVQRLWMAAVAVAAFLGVVKLSGRLGIGTPATRVAAGFAYALAPRGLTLLGVLSAEFLPAAMLPWILLPLVTAVRAGPSLGTAGRVKAAARSAVAVALCSGNNAASVLVMLTAAAIYLITAPRSTQCGRRTHVRRPHCRCLPTQAWRLIAWWVPAVLLATLWWIYPLLLLGKYGVSFLPYTESAAVTTSVTSLSNTLRGTEDWVSYLVIDGSPWWPVGFALVTGAVTAIATAVVAGLGLTGLLRPGMRLRRYLLVVLIIGVLIVSAGYVSGLGDPLAGPIGHLLNGPLAPLRNLRKFDPLIRLPVALGLAHLLATIGRPAVRKAASIAAAVAMAALMFPALTGGLSARGDFPAIPPYWLHAVAWLNGHAGNQAVLAVPGARFGEYTWGRPMDDVLEALFRGDWASRQLNGIGSIGNARLLDAIDEQMSAGRGSAALTATLARMGIRYVIVRNDLMRSDLGGDWPAWIHQALAGSPGIRRVAAFGTVPVGSFIPDDAVRSFDTPYPPVEIYQVRGAQPVVTVQPAAGTLRVYGGPEALLTIAGQGILRDRPVVLNADPAGLDARQWVVTDSLRRRVRNFGELRSDYSPTLTASDPARTFAAADDFTEPAWRHDMAVARYYGISGVTASSSAADITAIVGQSATGRLPFAAVDGDLRTMWESGALTGPVGQWIRIGLDQSLNPGSIGVAFADNPVIGPPVTEVTVSTAAGALTEPVRQTGGFQALRLPPGATTWLRIQVAATSRPGGPGTQAGIAGISIPGVSPSRTIVAPDVRPPGGGDPAAFVLSKAEPMWPGCMRTSLRWVCSPLLAKPTEEQYGFDQSFTAAAATPATLTGTAILANASLVERYAWLGAGQPVISGSSVYTPDPQDQPQAAFDGDPATTWLAGGNDAKPRLSITLKRSMTISQLAITRPAGAAGPMLVQVTGTGGQIRSGYIVRPTARLRFVPITTKKLVLTFTPASLPLQITDVTVPGVRPLTSAGRLPFRLSCGLGPNLRLDGKVIKTRVSGTFGALLTGSPLHFAACEDVSLPAGLDRVTEPSWDAFDIQAIVLDRLGPAGLLGSQVASPHRAVVVAWGPARRVVRVQVSQPSYLMTAQNFNQGWQASIGDRVLRPVELDGWRQAWLLPAGTAGLVTMTYLPDAGYRLSLLGGLALLGLVMVVAFVPVRRRRYGREGPAGRSRRGAHAQPREPLIRWPRPPSAGPQPSAAALPPAAAGAVPAEAVSTAEAGAEAAEQPQPAGGRPTAPPMLRWGLIGLAVLALLAACGLWMAGYPGALILPVAVVAFVTVLPYRRRPVVRVLASPWLVAMLLIAAAASGAGGQHLFQIGQGGPLATELSNTGPQVVCLVVMARLIAWLIMAGPEPRAEPAAPAQAEHEAAPAGEPGAR